METDYAKFDSAYGVCKFLDTLEKEQVIGITSNGGSFYVFYRKE